MKVTAEPAPPPEKTKVSQPTPAAPSEKKDSAVLDMFHVDERIPKALRDLMETHLVSEEELQKVVADQGYYPNATPILNYDPGFISGVLVGAWPQVYEKIQALRETYEIPFN